tara:strand:+ start:386 stop:535 length:150 start_codon:yes stop_codon:yes gene_type:complete
MFYLQSRKGAEHALRKAHVKRAINEQAPPASVVHYYFKINCIIGVEQQG